jgi:pyroglutamyl-peptidase
MESNRIATQNRRLLITAFDAFGALTSNPSAELIESLQHHDPTLWCEVLPTSYEKAWRTLRDLLKERPRALLMFGYSKKVTGLRLEEMGRNQDHASSTDNDGALGGPVILAGAPASIRAKADVSGLAGELEAEGVVAATSDDAGGYVCNHTYFRALAGADQWGIERCLFVHVGAWRGTVGEDDVLRGARLLIDRFGNETRSAAR